MVKLDIEKNNNNLLVDNKALLFFKNYKLYVILFLSSIFLFLSGFWKPFEIFASILVAIFIIFSGIENVFFIYGFSFFFTGMTTFAGTIMAVSFFRILIQYIIDLCKKRARVYKLPLILTVFMAILYSSIFYSVTLKSFFYGMVIDFVLFIMYFTFVYRDKIKVMQTIKYSTFGLLISSIIALLFYLIPNVNFEIGVVDSVGLFRCKLLTAHVNHLSVYCLFLIAFAFYFIINKKGNFIFNLFQIILSIVAGLFTMSKTFILLLLMIAIYMFIYLLIKYKWKSLRIIIPVLFVVGIFSIIFKDRIVDFVNRFFVYFDDGSILNQITTGRYDIWIKYCEVLTSSIGKMLFGVGLFSVELVEIGPHSLYLYILSRFGFVGMILFGILFYLYIKEANEKFSIKYQTILPIFAFLLISLVEYFDDFLFFVLAVIILLEKEQDNDKNELEYNKYEKFLTRDMILSKNKKTNKKQ